MLNFKTLATIFGIVNDVVSGIEKVITKSTDGVNFLNTSIHKSVHVGTQWFNIIGTIQLSDTAITDVTHINGLSILTALITDLAELEMTSIGTPIKNDYSFAIDNGKQYSNLSLTLTRVG